MNIADIVSTDYIEFTPETPVSKLLGAFEDPSVTAVVVRGAQFEGVVTRRQLVTSHHHPDEKVGSLVWHVPRLDPEEDVRTVARLMNQTDSKLLPVFEGPELIGVVTVDDVLREVRPFLDAATVAEAATTGLVTVDPTATVGSALHDLREHQFTHLPVVEADETIGILSLYDVMDFTIRSESQSQGGDAGGTDSFGGSLETGVGRSRRGGFGARDGELDRMLDVPVRDLMVSPVRTIAPEETLDVAVEAMFSIDGSSLVVTEDGSPVGIVTKTDVLDALTWEAEGNRPVQVYGTDLVDDVSYDEIVAMIDGLDEKDRDVAVLDAKVHLHEHAEQLRGTPLLLARIRLDTDEGLYVADGEGYGAPQALNEAEDVMERQIRDAKTYGRTKKHPDEEFWEKRFGWSLVE